MDNNKAFFPYTFSPISQDIHINLTTSDEESQMKIVHEYDEDKIITEQPQYYGEEEFCVTGTPSGIFRTVVGFLSFVCLSITLAANHHNLNPQGCSNGTDHNLPKFFINSLKVPSMNISEGELCATWDVGLTISNEGENSTTVNFVDMEAFVVYKEKEDLAVKSEMKRERDGIVVMEENERKTLNMRLETTGWESEQPIVDDEVIQEVAKDRKRGSVKLGLKIMVRAEIKVNYMQSMSVIMYPHCSDLEVHFPSIHQPAGEAAVLINGKPRECLGPVEWGY